MIRALVDFALRNRWLVLGGTVVLIAWGIVSFRNLPIEAYPDVANNYVQIITQWPGRSAEEIERQVEKVDADIVERARAHRGLFAGNGDGGRAAAEIDKRVEALAVGEEGYSAGGGWLAHGSGDGGRENKGLAGCGVGGTRSEDSGG